MSKTFIFNPVHFVPGIFGICVGGIIVAQALIDIPVVAPLYRLAALIALFGAWSLGRELFLFSQTGSKP